MNAVFYSLAFGGSQVAPAQLVRSLESLRAFDRELPVFVFLFGTPPAGFVEQLCRLGAKVCHLGGYLDYIALKHPDRAELFALDPKIHRWLVLEEPELKSCTRLLYIDSDTLFFARPSALFDRYQHADLYAREEPFCRRSPLGYNPAYVDETQLAELRASEGVSLVPPFNTGVCLFTREMGDAITSALPRYFDNLFRFLSWFHIHSLPEAAAANSSIQAVYDPRFRPMTDRALAYPSRNRWIVDQIAMWLALGQFTRFRYADFRPSHVWQGAEFYQASTAQPLPILSHYFSSNTTPFFDWLQRRSGSTARR